MIVDPKDLRHDKRPRKKPIYKKKIVNEIKEVEDKINDLNSFINNQNQHLVNFTNKKMKSEVLDKVSKAIKSEIFNQEKLKQLKLKLKREEKKHE